MADVRTLHWYQTEEQSQVIKGTNMFLQLAKTVQQDGNGTSDSNVFAQIELWAPTVTIQWTTDYALNWTSAVVPGATVTLGGLWQPCNRGDSYDIDASGYFQKSTTPGTPGWLSVGAINYNPPDATGVYIIVGVRDPAGDYSPIYVDSTLPVPGGTRRYSPAEKAEWWLQSENDSPETTPTFRGAATVQDYSQPASGTGTYEWWTTYSLDNANWSTSPSAPAPPVQLDSLPKSEESDDSPTSASRINVSGEGLKSLRSIFKHRLT